MLKGSSMLRGVACYFPCYFPLACYTLAKGVCLEFGERELAVAVDVARSEERSRLTYRVAA